MFKDEPPTQQLDSPEVEKPPVRQDRWAQAIQDLEDRDRELLAPLVSKDDDKSQLIGDILKEVETRKAACLKKRWKVRINNHEIVIHDVLDKISSWLSKFLSIGDVLVSIDPAHAAAPWAAVRLIVQTAVSHSETFGVVLSSIERVTNHIVVCSIFEKQYLQPEHRGLEVYERLSTKVTTLYKQILAYLCTAIRYYNLRTVARHVKSIVTSKADMEAKYQPITATQTTIDDYAKLADTQKLNMLLEKVDLAADRELVTAQEQKETSHSLELLLEDLRGPIARTATHLELINDELGRKTRARILKAISTVSYTQHHKVACKGRLKGSGQWLLDKPAFREWRQDSASSVLWLHGIPGAGKTKLASMVIDELLANNKVAYFYCMRTPAEPQRGQCDKILASLVRQLASVGPGKPVLLPVAKAYREAIDGFAEFEDQVWSTEESETVLAALLEEYPAITIVIDALDEVQYGDRQILMNVFGRLMKNNSNLLKVFIASRNDLDIVLQLEGSPNIRIAAEDNQKDIESFLNDRLNNANLLHGELTSSLRQQIVEVLTRDARGMFRWVDLQIQSLVPLKRAADILDRLGKLPPTLEESYWEIYQTILESGKHASKLAIFTFQWLLYSSERTYVQILEGLAAAVDCESLSVADFVKVTSNEIIDVCANLVVVRDYVLEFAHLSVREFLETLHLRGIDSMAPEAGNLAIAVACLRYFLATTYGSIDTVHKETTQTKNDLSSNRSERAVLSSEPLDRVYALLEKNSKLNNSFIMKIAVKMIHFAGLKLLRYAMNKWFIHANRIASLRRKKPLCGLIHAICINQYDRDAISPIYKIWVACAGGNSSFDMKPHPALTFRTPIWPAVEFGWDDLVDDFYRLNPYRGINDEDLILGDTPMTRAIKMGNTKVVSRMLAWCNDDVLVVPARFQQYDLLLDASSYGHCEIVSLILEREHGGLAVETAALDIALERGDAAIARLLAKHDPGVLLHIGPDKLLFAIRTKQEEMLMMLVDNLEQLPPQTRGKLLNTVIVHGGTAVTQRLMRRILFDMQSAVGILSEALIAAVTAERPDMTRLLLDRGAQREADAVARTIELGEPTSSILLIHAGFDIYGHYFAEERTALHLAAERGYDTVVQELLRAGANVNARDKMKRTPLYLAAANARLACCKILLENRGADMLAKDVMGRVALDVAEERGHAAVADVIRETMRKMPEELRSGSKERQA